MYSDFSPRQIKIGRENYEGIHPIVALAHSPTDLIIQVIVVVLSKMPIIISGFLILGKHLYTFLKETLIEC